MRIDSLTTREAEPAEDTPDVDFPYHTNIADDMRAGQTSAGVVLTLAEILGRPPEAMPSLQTGVDCDALDQLFHPQYTNQPSADTTVTIPYAGYTVTVRGDGCLRIRTES